MQENEEVVSMHLIRDYIFIINITEKGGETNEICEGKSAGCSV